MDLFPAALVLGLPAVVAAHALLERRRVQASRRWPTTVAELTEGADAYSYIVRGQAHRLEITIDEGDGDDPPPPETRVHYDPTDPTRAFPTDFPLPSLIEPIGTSLLAALGIVALIAWLV